jgi:hypothetical protein
MSPPLPRYTRTFLTTVSHTRRPQVVDYEPSSNGNTNPTPHRLFIPNPEDLRGIPCIAPGVGGTQPGTSPHHMAACGMMDT